MKTEPPACHAHKVWKNSDVLAISFSGHGFIIHAPNELKKSFEVHIHVLSFNVQLAAAVDVAKHILAHDGSNWAMVLAIIST